jgi:hypothetical protein
MYVCKRRKKCMYVGKCMWENVCGKMYVGKCVYVGAQTSNAWQYLHFSPTYVHFSTYIRTFFTYERRASAPTGQWAPAMVSPLSSRPVDVKIVRFDPVTSLEIQVSPLGRFLAGPASYIYTFFTYRYIHFHLIYIHFSHTFLHILIHTFSYIHFPTYIFPHAYIFSHTFPHIHIPTYIHFLFIHFPHTNVCM